ncbi:hypothetical protein POPTR_003G207600v4 [Populus trichocarpa]|uniref:Uncharacterized protein n=1 Tax=Populus trichocarpa TaxID=3694 RepID=A0A2K2BAA2_POPTR|nr:uncharacterized protein LOC7478332 [Populus trichocarpa]KAI5596208.1 hypothetical protein BDE02_03G191000 [Populus trichocarpa]PNT46711.1 hypothetical protein POPTR_003G207600v4 [Populus trichocarpa]|eukprot:XP_002304757.3 uncharacterized protein LOC7478332 [Populus trichocarpa]
MTMDRNSPPETPGRDSKSFLVLSIECLKGTSKADEWKVDMLQTGDIVEEILIGSGSSSSSSSGSGGLTRYSAPFKNGKSGVQKILHNSFKNKETSIVVRVRRGGDEFAELHACVVPESGYKNKYVLRSIADPNYSVGFTDRSEAECFELQASRSSRIVSALQRAKLQDGYVGYPWEKRMQELLDVPNSSSFLSLLLLPKASDPVASRYNDLEDTLARANAWLHASQASGVSIVFMNIQTESLLTKISGETASSTVNAGSLSDLSNLAHVSLYGFEDYHGVDIGVVRAVRLWYAPLCGEFAIEVKIQEDDTKLGFAISRTEEGFIFISSVMDGDENAPSTRSGLSNLYKEAKSASRLLVVSRVSNEKVLPWMVSSTGAVRCFDTVSLSQKLSLHRHAKVPILIHVFLWDRTLPLPSAGSARFKSVSPPVLAFPPEIQLAHHLSQNQILPLPADVPNDAVNEAEGRLDRDTAGEASFRFHDFSPPNNWV